MATEIPPWEKYTAAKAAAPVDDTEAWNAYAGVKIAPQQQAAAPAKAAPARSGVDETLHRAGVLGRGLLTGPTSTVGMVGDALNTAINMGGRAIGHDPQLGMPSQAIQGAMDSAGLPRAENTTERVIEGLGAVGTGSRDPLMGALTRFMPAAQGAVPTEAQKALMAGQREGYQALPSEMGAGHLGPQIEAISGKKPLAQSMQVNNQNLTNTMARRIAKLAPDTPLTEESIGRAMNATMAEGYDPIKNIGNITTGSVYRKALDSAIENNHGNAGFPFSDDVKKLVNQYRMPNFDSAAAVSDIQRLRQQSFNRMLDPNVRGASRDIAHALENNIELNLRASPGKDATKILSDFRNARKELAQQHVVMDALERGTGNVNSLNVAGKLKRNGENYLTGDLATMGNFAANAGAVSGVPKAQGVPELSVPIRHSILTALAGIFGGGVPAAGVASLPIGQTLLRHGIMSQAGQKMMQPQLDPRLLARIIHNKGAVNAMPAAMQQSGLYGQ